MILSDEMPSVCEVQIAGHAWYRFTQTNASTPVICGFQGTDFILGVGDGSVEEILARRQHEPPAWLVELRKDLPIRRIRPWSTSISSDCCSSTTKSRPTRRCPRPAQRSAGFGLDNLSAGILLRLRTGRRDVHEQASCYPPTASRGAFSAALFRPAAAGRGFEAHPARLDAALSPFGSTGRQSSISW